MPTRCAIYARVSSAGQRDAHTIDGQLVTLREHAARKGWKVTGEYLDDGKSARAGEKYLAARDGLARLLVAAAARAFDVVLIFDVDRLSRSDDPLERWTILAPFRHSGIRVVTPSAEIDLSTFEGEIMALIKGRGAADWLALHKERILQGKERAVGLGRKPAGPTPYGLTYDRDCLERSGWSLDPERAPIVREIYERVAAGQSMGQIADDLTERDVPRPRAGLWTVPRLWQLLQVETYVGRWSTSVRGREYVLAVPAIVTEELRAAALDHLTRFDRRGHSRTRHVYLLEGIARCSRCGAKIRIASGRPSERTRAAYICAHRLAPQEYRADRCALRRHATDELDARVRAAILDATEDPGLIAALFDQRSRSTRADIAAWRQDLEQAERAIARLAAAEASTLALLRRGRASEEAVERELAAIGRERKQHERQRDAARRASTTAAVDEDRIVAAAQLAADLHARLSVASPEEWRDVAREILLDPMVTDDGVMGALYLGEEPVPQQSVPGWCSERLDDVCNYSRFKVVA